MKYIIATIKVSWFIYGKELKVGNDGWRVLVTKVTNKYVTFFAGYDTITEEIKVFTKGYTKEL
jgi:hypothetical protein